MAILIKEDLCSSIGREENDVNATKLVFKAFAFQMVYAWVTLVISASGKKYFIFPEVHVPDRDARKLSVSEAKAHEATHDEFVAYLGVSSFPRILW